MAFWRRAKGGPSPCPACDTPLDPGLAREEERRCPQCGLALLPVRVAGFWTRTASAIADLAVLLLTAGLLSWGLVALAPPKPIFHGPLGVGTVLELLSAEPRDVLAWVTPFLLMSGIYFLLFWGLSGQTPGQRLLHIRVVDRSGRPPGPLAAAVRLVAQAIGLVPGALGSIWIAFDTEKRAFHDHLAGTYVVADR